MAQRVLLFTGMLRSKEIFISCAERMRQLGTLERFDRVIVSTWASELMKDDDVRAFLDDTGFEVVLSCPPFESSSRGRLANSFLFQMTTLHNALSECSAEDLLFRTRPEMVFNGTKVFRDTVNNWLDTCESDRGVRRKMLVQAFGHVPFWMMDLVYASSVGRLREHCNADMLFMNSLHPTNIIPEVLFFSYPFWSQSERIKALLRFNSRPDRYDDEEELARCRQVAGTSRYFQLCIDEYTDILQKHFITIGDLGVSGDMCEEDEAHTARLSPALMETRERVRSNRSVGSTLNSKPLAKYIQGFRTRYMNGALVEKRPETTDETPEYSAHAMMPSARSLGGEEHRRVLMQQLDLTIRNKDDRGGMAISKVLLDWENRASER